jgi:hypothetical protein
MRLKTMGDRARTEILTSAVQDLSLSPDVAMIDDPLATRSASPRPSGQRR